MLFNWGNNLQNKSLTMKPVLIQTKKNLEKMVKQWGHNYQFAFFNNPSIAKSVRTPDIQSGQEGASCRRSQMNSSRGSEEVKQHSTPPQLLINLA